MYHTNSQKTDSVTKDRVKNTQMCVCITQIHKRQTLSQKTELCALDSVFCVPWFLHMRVTYVHTRVTYMHTRVGHVHARDTYVMTIVSHMCTYVSHTCRVCAHTRNVRLPDSICECAMTPAHMCFPPVCVCSDTLSRRTVHTSWQNEYKNLSIHTYVSVHHSRKLCGTIHLNTNICVHVCLYKCICMYIYLSV